MTIHVRRPYPVGPSSTRGPDGRSSLPGLDITSAAEVIHANRDYLTQLDAAIGDADHGIDLDRGFTAALRALNARNGAALHMTPGRILAVTGNTIVSEVGGAAGPLYGVAFRGPGMRSALPATWTCPALCRRAGETALAASQDSVPAPEGDDHGRRASSDTQGFRSDHSGVAGRSCSMLGDRLAAAIATIPMQALEGRAGSVGSRSIGHQDQGATSATLICALRTPPGPCR